MNAILLRTNQEEDRECYRYVVGIHRWNDTEDCLTYTQPTNCLYKIQEVSWN